MHAHAFDLEEICRSRPPTGVSFSSGSSAGCETRTEARCRKQSHAYTCRLTFASTTSAWLCEPRMGARRLLSHIHVCGCTCLAGMRRVRSKTGNGEQRAVAMCTCDELVGISGAGCLFHLRLGAPAVPPIRYVVCDGACGCRCRGARTGSEVHSI